MSNRSGHLPPPVQRQERSSHITCLRSCLAPINPVSIPRLELCGAVLAVQAVDKILKELDMAISEGDVLHGFKGCPGLHPQREQKILRLRGQIKKTSTPDQWKYVESANNPADLATRGLKAKDLTESDLVKGLQFLRNALPSIPEVDADQVSLSDDDPEVCKEARVFATTVEPHDRGALHEEAFKKFSMWSSLRRAITTLITRARSSRMSDARYDISKREPEQRLSPEVLTQATLPKTKALKKKFQPLQAFNPRTKVAVRVSKKGRDN